MKKIYIISMVAAMLLTGCNEDKFLEEKALDFNSASNSYNTAADYDAAITELYYLTREESIPLMIARPTCRSLLICG